LHHGTRRGDSVSQAWEPKTKINRAMPISSTLRRYLDIYRRRIVPSGWNFPSPDGKWWDPDNFSHDRADANRAAALQWSGRPQRFL
jgi:hypothetical protein